MSLQARTGTAVLLVVLAICGSGRAASGGEVRTRPFGEAMADAMKAPGSASGPRIPLGQHPRTGYERFLASPVEGAQRPLFLGLLAFYRTVISPVNGDQSDVAPVHALYAVQAIKAHGVLLGTVLTTERLIHEPDELTRGPVFAEDGREFTYDPLIGNTFWLPDWMR